VVNRAVEEDVGPDGDLLGRLDVLVVSDDRVLDDHGDVYLHGRHTLWIGSRLRG
jgi:hypothetical protein